MAEEAMKYLARSIKWYKKPDISFQTQELRILLMRPLVHRTLGSLIEAG